MWKAKKNRYLFENLVYSNLSSTEIDEVKDERLQALIVKRRIKNFEQKSKTQSERSDYTPSQFFSFFNSEEHENSIIDENEEFYTSLKVGYIRKIYGMIIFQIILTYIVSLIGTIPVIIRLYNNNTSILNYYLTTNFIFLFSFYINKSLFRKFPYNYILLILFTISIGFSLSFIYRIISKQTITFLFSLLTFNILILYSFTAIYKTTIYYQFNFLFLLIVNFIIFIISYSMLSIKYAYITVGIYIYVFYIIANTSLLEKMLIKEISLDDYIYSSVCFYIADLIYAFAVVIEFVLNKL